MPSGQVEEIIALALVFGVHLLGGVMLVWALLEPEQRIGWRRRWGWGGDDPSPQPLLPGDGPAAGPRPRAPLPLTLAQPSRVRLREAARAADGYPRPARRPEHERQPQRAPAPGRQRHSDV